MKIDSKKFLAFNMHPFDKEQLILSFASETRDPARPDNESHVRADFMRGFLTLSDKNYLFTKTAMDLIKDIKIKDTPEIRQMILDNTDRESTFLINENEYIKVIRESEVDMEEGVGPVVMCMYIKREPDELLSYDGFNVTEFNINHPNYLQGQQVDRIDTFLKMMIFTKCTNSEIEVLGKTGGKLPRRANISGEKYVNNLDTDVTVVNAKHNKIVYRDEEFYVNPHGRFQRHGEKNSKVKYIIIDGYYKKGYKRGFKS